MINSIIKATDILHILSSNPEKTFSLSELSNLSSLNKSTCSHILETLCATFYVERVSRKEGYRLGPWAYMLSRKSRYQESLIQTSKSVIQWLHEQLNVTVFLDVMCNGKKFILYYIDDDRLILNSGDSILQGVMETSCSGLLHMAYMGNEQLREVIKTNSEEKEISAISAKINSLQWTFDNIRKNKYSYFYNKELQHHSYAFPIQDHSRVIAALGIVYTADRNSERFAEQVIANGLEAGREISRRIKFEQSYGK